MLITEAFAKFGAKQKNIQWSVSALNDREELVVSLWSHLFEKRSKSTMTYIDRASRWKGAGNNEFRKNLDYALEKGIIIRAVIAKSTEPEVIVEGGPGSNLGNTFHPKPEWVGNITLWDGDNFEIEFKQE